MSKKGIITIVVLILVVLIATIFFIKKHNSKYEYQLTTISINEVNYFALRQGESYGVIDKDGKVIIEPKYQGVVIPNPTKAVFIMTDGANPDVSYAVDKTGTKILTQYEDVEAIPINQTSSYVPFEKEVLKYKTNNLYGLMDLNLIFLAFLVYHLLVLLLPMHVHIHEMLLLLIHLEVSELIPLNQFV